MHYLRFVGVGLWAVFLFHGCGTPTQDRVEKIVVFEALKTSINVIAKNENSIEVDLVFENVSEKPLRIYYIDDPLFSRTQNSFYVKDKRGKNHFEIDDAPPPHGYMLSEKNFYLIASKDKKIFRQKILLQVKNSVSLQWIYRNQLTSMEGGIETLDGQNKAFFNGDRIPYIWTGMIKNSIKI
jgi:hypothetical protein